jgi:hypothetical protein
VEVGVLYLWLFDAHSAVLMKMPTPNPAVPFSNPKLELIMELGLDHQTQSFHR